MLIYQSIIHNNANPQSPLVSHICLELFWTVLICADFSPDSGQNSSSLEEALLWTRILVKNILMMDLFQLLSSQDV